MAPGGLRVPRQPLEMPARVTLEKPLVRFALVDAADARRLRRLRSRSLHRARHPVFLALPNPAIHRSPLAEEVQEAVPVQLLENGLNTEDSKSKVPRKNTPEMGENSGGFLSAALRRRRRPSLGSLPGSSWHSRARRGRRWHAARGLDPRSAGVPRSRRRSSRGRCIPGPRSSSSPAAPRRPLSSETPLLFLLAFQGDSGPPGLDGGLGDFLEDPRLARTRTARAEDPVEGEVPQHVLRLQRKATRMPFPPPSPQCTRRAQRRADAVGACCPAWPLLTSSRLLAVEVRRTLETL